MIIILPLSFIAIILILVAVSISHVCKYSFDQDKGIKNSEDTDEKNPRTSIKNLPVENVKNNNLTNKASRIVIIQRIKEAIKVNNRLFPECPAEEINEYVKDSKSFLFNKFENWTEDDVEHFRYYCDCGVKKLQIYALHGGKADMDVATDIIYHIDDKILKHLDYKRAEDESSVYWDFAIYFTRLLVCYEYLADDELVDNKLICHNVVNKVTSILNNEFYSTDDWIDHNPKKVVYLNISRLLTNYLYSKKKFEALIENDTIDLIRRLIPQVKDPQYKNIYSDVFGALRASNC